MGAGNGYEKIRERMCRAEELGDALELAGALNQAAGSFCGGLISEEELSRLVDVSDDVLWRLKRKEVMDDEEP